MEWAVLQRFWKVRWESILLRSLLDSVCGRHVSYATGTCFCVFLAQLGWWGSMEEPSFMDTRMSVDTRNSADWRQSPAITSRLAKKLAVSECWSPHHSLLLVSYCLTSAVLWLVRSNKIVIWNCNFTLNPSERLAWSVHHLLECTTAGSLIW